MERLFTEAMERYGSIIRATVLKRMGRLTPDWEDIIQNIHLSIWIALSRFRGESTVSTYVYPIVNYRINDYLRTLYRGRKLIKRAERDLKFDNDRGGENSLSEREEEIRKNRGIGFLTPAEFRVFKLISQGKTNDEITELLFISKNTVRSHYKKITSKLEFNDRVKLALFAYKFLDGGIR